MNARPSTTRADALTTRLLGRFHKQELCMGSKLLPLVSKYAKETLTVLGLWEFHGKCEWTQLSIHNQSAALPAAMVVSCWQPLAGQSYHCRDTTVLMRLAVVQKFFAHKVAFLGDEEQ